MEAQSVICGSHSLRGKLTHEFTYDSLVLSVLLVQRVQYKVTILRNGDKRRHGSYPSQVVVDWLHRWPQEGTSNSLHAFPDTLWPLIALTQAWPWDMLWSVEWLKDRVSQLCVHVFLPLTRLVLLALASLPPPWDPTQLPCQSGVRNMGDSHVTPLYQLRLSSVGNLLDL